MKQTPVLLLTGYLGSGKTTCGKLLAETLNRPFVDCDEFIEGYAKRSISEIFEQEGEEGFRDLESLVISVLSKWKKRKIKLDL